MPVGTESAWNLSYDSSQIQSKVTTIQQDWTDAL
jgi:hypothetical protein